MNSLLVPYKGYLYGALGIGLILLGLYVKHYINDLVEEGYKTGYDKATVEQQLVQLEYSLAYAKALKDANEQVQKDTSTINSMHSTIDGLQHSITVPSTCSSGTSEGRDKTSGVFPSKVQGAFDKFTAGLGQLILECDQMNVSAIGANKVQ